MQQRIRRMRGNELDKGKREKEKWPNEIFYICRVFCVIFLLILFPCSSLSCVKCGRKSIHRLHVLLNENGWLEYVYMWMDLLLLLLLLLSVAARCCVFYRFLRFCFQRSCIAPWIFDGLSMRNSDLERIHWYVWMCIETELLFCFVVAVVVVGGWYQFFCACTHRVCITHILICTIVKLVKKPVEATDSVAKFTIYFDGVKNIHQQIYHLNELEFSNLTARNYWCSGTTINLDFLLLFVHDFTFNNLTIYDWWVGSS